MSYRKGAHTVYDLNCHVVWITKYRKPVWRGEVAVRLRELVRQTCASLEVFIESGPVTPDHVHLLLSVPPELSVSELMPRIKGRSSRKLLDEFSDWTGLGRVGHDLGPNECCLSAPPFSFTPLTFFGRLPNPQSDAPAGADHIDMGRVIIILILIAL